MSVRQTTSRIQPITQMQPRPTTTGLSTFIYPVFNYSAASIVYTSNTVQALLALIFALYKIPELKEN